MMQTLSNFVKHQSLSIKIFTTDHFLEHQKYLFSKWYVKGYSDGSEIIKILKAIGTDTHGKLNLNLKSKPIYITIIKVMVVG